LHGFHVAQVLLTHEDLSDRTRYLSARHALREMLALGAAPVVNENDTVAVDEIRFGDNDRLAALIAPLVGADALVILTDVEGLCDAPPEQGGRLISRVDDVDAEAAPIAGMSISGVGTGGMASKVQAAKIAARYGVPTVVASGDRAGAVRAALAGEDVGTLFAPSAERLKGRKHWIAYALRSTGKLVVDEGAHHALVGGKRSLLPSGVRAVEGTFQAGEAVAIATEAGQEFARGLAAYSSDELARIAGRRSTEIEAVLGYKLLDEAVHRDDLVIL
jgi:glutamate 5-kinase